VMRGEKETETSEISTHWSPGVQVCLFHSRGGFVSAGYPIYDLKRALFLDGVVETDEVGGDFNAILGGIDGGGGGDFGGEVQHSDFAVDGEQGCGDAKDQDDQQDGFI